MDTQTTVQPQYKDFLLKIATRLKLPATTSNILSEFVDIDVNAEAIARVLKRNQYYEYLLLRQVKSLGLKEDFAHLNSSIVMLGMTGTRNLICSLQLYRSITGKHPPRDKEGNIAFKAADLLKFALKSEDHILSAGQEYADTAFAAGMIYDFFSLLGKEVFSEPKGFEEYLEDLYKHSFRAARIAFALSQQLKHAGFAKYIFSGSLIHDVGKLALELLFPPGADNSFQKFREDVKEKQLSREVLHFLEVKRFTLSHEYYSSQIASFFDVFKQISSVMLFHHEPYLIRSDQKDMAGFAATIALASNIASSYRVPADSKDPVFKQWISPELRKFNFDPKVILTVIRSLPRDIV